MDRLRRRLARQKALGLGRVLSVRDTPPGRICRKDGREVLSFSTNDYLGLSSDQRLSEAASVAARLYGFGAASARLLAGHTPAHRSLEEALAGHLGTESAVVLSAGYLANVAATSVLLTEGEPAWFDRANHSSLRDGVAAAEAERIVYAHRDVKALELLVRNATPGRGAILTESVFSMDGDVSDLPALRRFADAAGIPLLVDEAHAIGVFGPDGRGCAAEAGLARGVVLTATLSKALGAQGGVVAGPREVIESIVSRGRSFLFATGLAPPVAAAANEALRISIAEPERRERLWRLAERLRRGLAGLSFDLGQSRGPIIPIRCGSVEATNAASDSLLSAGIFVPSIRPPTVPHGESRLRVSLSSSHEEGDVDRLLEAISRLPGRS